MSGATLERLGELASRLLANQPSDGPLALIVLSGLPASGKSHLARLLSTRLLLPVIASDAVRRALFAVRTYDSAESNVVYSTCRQLAALRLSQGQGAIIDATNLRESGRLAWQALARRQGAAFVLVRVVASDQQTRDRMLLRAHVGDPGLSEATLGVYELLRDRHEPTALEHVLVLPETDLAEAVRDVAGRVAQQLAAPPTVDVVGRSSRDG